MIRLLLVAEGQREGVRHLELEQSVERMGGTVMVIWTELSTPLEAYGGCVALLRYAAAGGGEEAEPGRAPPAERGEDNAAGGDAKEPTMGVRCCE